jgi:Fur family peroxide stress response transcriptional regulator
MKDIEIIKEVIKNSGLKATTQRLVIYSAISENFSHPTAEEIYTTIKDEYPSISLSTVYNTLDTLVEHHLINPVKNSGGLLRYDAITKPHHHLYCKGTDKIVDYHNEELDKLLSEYFEKNNIPGFSIEEVNIQIKGTYK